jgi:hypothetical protein
MSTATQPLAIPRVGLSALLRDYSVLVKARVTTLIILTTWCGAYLAAAKSGVPAFSWTVFNVLLGIGLVSVQDVSDFQAVQLWRIQWLMAACAAFLVGILFKNNQRIDS